MLIYKALGLSTSTITTHITTIRFFLPYICIIPVYRRLSKKQIVFLLSVALLTMAVTMIWNVYLKSVWGYRYSTSLSTSSGVRGVINTQYTSAILFLSGVLLCAFLHARPGIRKFAYLVGVVFCIYFNLAITQRAIILFLSVFMVVLLLLYNREKQTAPWVIGSAIVILATVLVIFYYEAVLTWLADRIGSYRLQKRINSVIRLFQTGSLGEAGGGSLSTRLQLTGKSLKTFFSSLYNFVIGTGHITDNNNLIGNHSQLVDEFARFGVVGGTLSLTLILSMLRDMRTMSGVLSKSTLRHQIVVISITCFMRMCLGTLFSGSIGTVLFIIAPLIFQMIQIKEMEHL